MRSLRTGLGVLIAAAAVTTAVLLEAGPAKTAEPVQKVAPGTRAVLFVANNWDGTADMVDPTTFQKLDRFNVVPDLEERMAEIQKDPQRLGYFLAIRELIGEGNDQFADDMFSSHDGRFVYISRPSLRDVIGMDLKTKQIVWRFVVDGQRSDHMAISRDGKRLLISASTGNVVHELDAATGKEVGRFESGDSPHESNYSADGKRIFHASIGLVYTPADQPFADSSKGKRYFQIVEAGTNKILKRLDIGQIMAAQGFPGYSSAVRPMAISPDEKIVYMQLSFLHGFVVFDVEKEKVLKIVDLPKQGEGETLPREGYLLDSAHHGLAINPEGTKLCAAGTMSDYAAIVSTGDFSFTKIDNIKKPYWSTNSGDGKYCFISASGADEVVVADYATGKEVTRIPVGDHPQRMRMGVIRKEFVAGAPRTGETAAPRAPAARARRVPNLQIRRARVRGGQLQLGLAVRRGVRGRVQVSYRAGGKRIRFRSAIARSGRWTVRRTLPARIRGIRTGAVEVRFAGNRSFTRDSVRIRTGARAARLRVTRAAVQAGGRLTLAGTAARGARGTVRVRLAYAGSGTRTRFLRYTAPIRNGRWVVRSLLPTQAARAGGYLSVQYSGDARRRVAGQHLIRRLRP
jgi:DNA-binding beta-propeller fold protein YncE